MKSKNITNSQLKIMIHSDNCSIIFMSHTLTYTYDHHSISFKWLLVCYPMTLTWSTFWSLCGMLGILLLMPILLLTNNSWISSRSLPWPLTLYWWFSLVAVQFVISWSCEGVWWSSVTLVVSNCCCKLIISMLQNFNLDYAWLKLTQVL